MPDSPDFSGLSETLGDVARGLGWDPGMAAVVGLLLSFLTFSTLLRGFQLRRVGTPATRRRWRSLLTWWILVVSFVAILWIGPEAAVPVLACLSLLLLHETLRLVGAENAFSAASVAGMVVYALAWAAWRPLFTLALPVAAAILVLSALAAHAASRPRIRGTSTAFLVSVVGPSFAVAVASLPAPSGRPLGSLGWFALLVVLTELNDASQAWWGRTFGRRQMAPRISPLKTWAGLAGGMATTVSAALVLSPLLTEYGRSLPGFAAPPWLGAVGIGLLVSLSGVAGDLFASVLKRRAGVKDSGSLLPGHGGVLDRFDSLTWTAPVYFGVTWILWFHGS